MVWKNILFLFLFLLVSGMLFSEVCLTNQEYENLMMYLDELEMKLENSNQKIMDLQNQLDFSKIVINNLENSLMTSNAIIQNLKALSQEQENYYKEQRKDQLIKNLKFLGLGFAIGFAGGSFMQVLRLALR